MIANGHGRQRGAFGFTRAENPAIIRQAMELALWRRVFATVG
jgi:hypothetical protein